MAHWYEPDAEQLASWKEFLDGLPEGGLARANAERFPPWKLLRFKTTDHRVFVHSYADSGTMTVVVLGRFNFVAFERKVFGISPEDLEPCELPGPDEKLGVFMNEEQQLEHINMLRAELGNPPFTVEELERYNK